MGIYYEAVRDRLIRYAKIGTQSREDTDRRPSTDCQFDLARVLARELKEIGAEDVWLDEKACLVYAGIPGSEEGKDKTPLGLIAHMDTAPDAPGSPVRPWVLPSYGGGDIVLHPEKGIVMRAADFPNLAWYISQDLVLTDGTTLLGGDDKASIAAIMTLAEALLARPDIPHRPVRLAFTPDEEVGGLAIDLDLDRFGAPFAYTMDGDHLGWYMDETFNAASAHVTILGRSVHTGTAKGIMINAGDIACDFLQALPPRDKPQYTEGKEGFFHLVSCRSACERADLDLIIRDFDADAFEGRKQVLRDLAAALNKKWGQGTVSLDIRDQYRNMKEVLDRYPHLIEELKAAIRAAGLNPVCQPFRGGTDGSTLTFRGLPCPNLSAGYENAHGRFEFVPIQSMEKNVEILLHLCRP